MKKDNETISLLPFLESTADAFLLDIPVLDQSRPQHGHTYPFHLADSERNFSIIVNAGLKVSGSKHAKPLFLLVQRDYYPIQPDVLSQVTNTGIDRIWLQTLLTYSHHENGFIIPRQLSREDQATPFKSLFYCKKEKVFFHPPCPECGEDLVQCTDDDILIRQALPPYTTSLKRYLFCPGCYAEKGSHSFYQYARSTEDRIYIKDRFDLIRGFHKLKRTKGESFPCTGCSNHGECYMIGEKAANHIGFFSFYPFHMVMLDAGLMKAVHFLPLLSGALFTSVKENMPPSTASFLDKRLAPGKADCFFFEGHDRFYLEVLFLKLSFFEQILLFLKSSAQNQISPLQLTVQSIWVHPTEPGSTLPFFWDFKVRVIDLVSDSSTKFIEATLEKNSSLQFAAILFFYVFFVNQHQDQTAVYGELGRFLEKGGPKLSDYDRFIEAYPFAAMENIFWNPDSRKGLNQWQNFWLTLMETGVDLFHAAREKTLALSLDQTIKKISDFKHHIKAALFSRGSTASPMVQSVPQKRAAHRAVSACEGSDRPAIAMILKKLKAEWESAAEAPSDTGEADVLETIVLTSVETQTDAAEDDPVDKTIVLSPRAPGPESTTAEAGNGFDDMEATLILSPIKETDFFKAEEDLDKTVVINPKK